MPSTEKQKSKQKYSACHCVVNDRRIIHPGSLWRVLNPDPTSVEDPDNAYLFPKYRDPIEPQ